MPKQNKKSSNLKQLFTPSRLLLAYSVLASSVILLFIATFIPTYQWHAQYEAEQSFTRMVMDAHLATVDELVIEPLDGKAYLHEAKLRLPLTHETNDVLYDASDGDSNFITFYSKPALYEPAQKLGESLCVVLAYVSINEESDIGQDYPLEATVRLSDGRTMYVYPNRSKDCSKGAYIRQGIGPDTALGALKQAESY